MNATAPIGVFDSGVGGLSVWKELVRELPYESIVYVADSANAPYGSKSREFITGRSRAVTRFLAGQGCKLIVVACNTATGASISTLRKEFDLPFIGVEPAVKPAARDSRTGHIGVLATEQTFRGEHFQRSVRLFTHSVAVHERAGTGLVELVERGRAESEEARKLLESYLIPMVEKNIDELVLGCTHYPFLIPLIREILPEGVTIIDPAPAVARQTRKVLEENGGLNPQRMDPGYRFYSTGKPDALENLVGSLTRNHPEVILTDIPT